LYNKQLYVELKLHLIVDYLMLSWKSCCGDRKYKEKEGKDRQKWFSFHLTEREVIFQRQQTGVCGQPEESPFSNLLFGTIFHASLKLFCKGYLVRDLKFPLVWFLQFWDEGFIWAPAGGWCEAFLWWI